MSFFIRFQILLFLAFLSFSLKFHKKMAKILDHHKMTTTMRRANTFGPKFFTEMIKYNNQMLYLMKYFGAGMMVPKYLRSVACMVPQGFVCVGSNFCCFVRTPLEASRRWSTFDTTIKHSIFSFALLRTLWLLK